MSAPLSTMTRGGPTFQPVRLTAIENDSGSVGAVDRSAAATAERWPITIVAGPASSWRRTIRGFWPNTFSMSDTRSSTALARAGASSAPNRMVVVLSSTNGGPGGVARRRRWAVTCVPATSTQAMTAVTSSHRGVFSTRFILTAVCMSFIMGAQDNAKRAGSATGAGFRGSLVRFSGGAAPNGWSAERRIGEVIVAPVLADPLDYLFFPSAFLRAVFLSSSMVEHPAVNRRVPGSSPG